MRKLEQLGPGTNRQVKHPVLTLVCTLRLRVLDVSSGFCRGGWNSNTTDAQNCWSSAAGNSRPCVVGPGRSENVWQDMQASSTVGSMPSAHMQNWHSESCSLMVDPYENSERHRNASHNKYVSNAGDYRKAGKTPK